MKGRFGVDLAIFSHQRKSYKFELEGDLADGEVREGLERDFGDELVGGARTVKGFFKLSELRSGTVLIELEPEARPFPVLKAYDFSGGAWLGGL